MVDYVSNNGEVEKITYRFFAMPLLLQCVVYFTNCRQGPMERIERHYLIYRVDQKTGPQTHDHNSVNSYTDLRIFYHWKIPW